MAEARRVREAGEPLRTLYDLYWWNTGPQSGRVVVSEMLRAWRDRYPDDRFILAVRRVDRDSVTATFPGVETTVVRGRPHGLAVPTQFPWRARMCDADFVYTQNFAPPGVRSVVFIHDVMFQTNPEWFTFAERLYFRLIPIFARTAGRVAFHDLDGRDLVPACRWETQRWQEPRDDARRSARLRRAVPVAPLVVVGGENGRSTALDATARQAISCGLIRFVPKVSDAELAWLYRNADLFINLSLGEGFGLPPVEALSFGCPAIVSDIAVYRENLGDQASYVDPLDVGAVATATRSTAFGPIDPAPRLATWEDCVVRAREAIIAAVQSG